jgi:excisionase family DNA binding protein
MTEFLTVTELAVLLKMNKGQIYEMTKKRTRNSSDNPIPFFKFGSSVRFRVSDIERWLRRCADGER